MTEIFIFAVKKLWSKFKEFSQSTHKIYDITRLVLSRGTWTLMYQTSKQNSMSFQGFQGHHTAFQGPKNARPSFETANLLFSAPW